MIPREYIGRDVKLYWLDPTSQVRKNTDYTDLPDGPSGTATWEEHGVLDRITDGWVRLIKSHGTVPGEEDDWETLLVHEALVTRVVRLTTASEWRATPHGGLASPQSGQADLEGERSRSLEASEPNRKEGARGRFPEVTGY